MGEWYLFFGNFLSHLFKVAVAKPPDKTKGYTNKGSSQAQLPERRPFPAAIATPRSKSSVVWGDIKRHSMGKSLKHY